MNLVLFISELAFMSVEFISLHLQCRYKVGHCSVCFNLTAEEAEMPDVVRNVNSVAKAG